MMNPRRAGLIALVLGAALAALVAASAEWACAILLRRRGPLQRVPSSVACVQAGADGRSVVGPVETRHGIFPPPPAPVQRTGPDPVVSYAPDQIEDVRAPMTGGRLGPGLLRLPLRSFHFVRRLKGGQVIWDVPCLIDGFGRRETPGEMLKVRPEEFVLMLGDSFVLGECVGQGETMAAVLGRRLPWARVYNYGVSGLFFGEMLERMRLVRGAPEVRESRGTAFFFVNDASLRRSLYSLVSVGAWGHSRPYYRKNGKGEIVAEQYTRDARPVWTFLAKLFVRSRVLRYLNLDYPLHPAESDLLFMTELVAQVRAETRRFGADRFFVVLYPGVVMGRALVPYLEKAGIDYIDLSCWDLIKDRPTRGPAFIPGEGHPTPETHRLLGETLADVLSARRRAERAAPARSSRRGT